MLIANIIYTYTQAFATKYIANNLNPSWEKVYDDPFKVVSKDKKVSGTPSTPSLTKQARGTLHASHLHGHRCLSDELGHVLERIYDSRL